MTLKQKIKGFTVWFLCAALIAGCASVPQNGRDASIKSLQLSSAGKSRTLLSVNDFWHPGVYLKPLAMHWGTRNEAKFYNEIDSTVSIRGVVKAVRMPEYETETPGVYSFKQIGGILDKLAAMKADKRLILYLSHRSFNIRNGGKDLLPLSLQGSSGLDSAGNIKYNYLFSYNRNRGYNMRLWEPAVIAAIDSFLSQLSAYIDSHPNGGRLTMFYTEESAVGTPTDSYASMNGSEAAYYAGLDSLHALVKQHFPRIITTVNLNFTPEYVAKKVPALEVNQYGFMATNTHAKPSIAEGNGVLTYMPGKSNIVPIICGWDRPDWEKTDGVNADYPTPESIFIRRKEILKANFIIIQRISYWTSGHGGNESGLSFFQNNPLVAGKVSAGLNTTLPRCFASMSLAKSAACTANVSSAPMAQ